MLVLVILGSVVVTATISGIFGMAGGMILMGIYAALLPIPEAMMLHGVTQLASNGFRAWLLRKDVFWPTIRYYVVGAVVSVGVFSLFTWVVSKPILFVVLGALPWIAAALPAAASLRVENRFVAALCGLVVTAAHLIAGISGPLLDLFYLRGTLTRFQVIGTKAFTQSLAHMLKLYYFGLVVGVESSTLLVWIYPAVVIGAMIGTRIGRSILARLDDKQFRSWSSRIIRALGLVFLIRGLWLLWAGAE